MAKKATTKNTKPDPAKTEKARKAARAEIRARMDGTPAPAGDVGPTAAPAEGTPQTPPTREEAERLAARAAASVFGPEVLGPAADGAQPTPTSGTPTARGGKKTKEPRAATAPKPSKAPKVKTLSALDAAAQVLAKSTKPMSATEMIERMATQGLWESPGGKTPSATLYAAIIREISAKAGEARFRKVDRGMFEYAG